MKTTMRGTQKQLERAKGRLTVGLMLLLLVTGAAVAQVTPNATKATPATGKAAAPNKRYTNKEIADRPYSPELLPKPMYPSSPREQKQFTAQFIYNYAQSNYTPAVVLPNSINASKNTLETALTAFYSAMQAGDYDAWLLCWDEPSRAAFVKDATENHHDATYWRGMWKQAFEGKRVLLIDRIEMVGYVILDVKIVDKVEGNRPGASKAYDVPSVFKNDGGRWLLTNELSSDPMLTSFMPGQDKVVYEHSVLPISEIANEQRDLREAQKLFFENHVKTAQVIKVAR